MPFLSCIKGHLFDIWASECVQCVVVDYHLLKIRLKKQPPSRCLPAPLPRPPPASMPRALSRGTKQPQFTTTHKKIDPKTPKTYRIASDERNQLHSILHLARLEDQFSVPVPSDIDQDNNRFEILRGQIIAGNDNPDLIKDFKFLLMKLMTNGRIPRREGHDILADLAALGY